ncbi:protein GAMETE EXPRESSED 3 [Argentina anserina]|uniref:protein GAMETE EXPRESSED 3 n=1 Tax=Argentina anserina TaxID=57926 RepID=UPI0021762AB7|nr:protein GAMETE EXPRESSED 3 [Potentilla anserina]
MAMFPSLVLLSFLVFLALTHSQPGKEISYRRLSRPLIGHDGKVYACSEKDLLAFESNGTIAWILHLNYTCSFDMPPVHGGKENMYFVADNNRVLQVSLFNNGTSKPSAEVLLSTEPTKEGDGEIVGLAVSTVSSSVYVNIRRRGLFAYTSRGQLLWSAGPVIDQHGYQQGCRKNIADCYFNSVPVIDQCEASLYISNTAGELYSLSIRSPHFKWIQDLSSYEKVFSITPGNNGRLYISVPTKARLLALDVSSGNVLWEGIIGPLSTADHTPVVDSNGWISIGSLDGYLYTFSPTGVLKKFSKAAAINSVIQVTPFLDCTGFAVYIAQTEMEGKISHTVGEYTFVSALKPKGVVFTLYVPATGSIYWSGRYPGAQFSSLISHSDLHHFILDERIVLAFVAASKTGNPLACRSMRQKFMSSCSQVRPKLANIYTGSQRAILLFLLFESVILVLLAGLVRFCCIFWSKKKVQGQNLGTFLEKRRSLRLKKKAFDRTITELEQKAANEAVADNEALEKLGSLLQEREGIQRKLSTTYSLGRDRITSRSKSLLPLYDGKSRSHFQGAKKKSVAVFHTLSDASSPKEHSSDGESSWTSYEDKGKEPLEQESSSESESFTKDHRKSSSETASSSRRFVDHDEGEVQSLHEMRIGGRSFSLKKRRTMSSTN